MGVETNVPTGGAESGWRWHLLSNEVLSVQLLEGAVSRVGQVQRLVSHCCAIHLASGDGRLMGMQGVRVGVGVGIKDRVSS